MTKYACVAAVILAGCAQSDVPEKANYQNRMDGEFNESGTFSARVTIFANYEDSTFQGFLDEFSFTRQGFTSPRGRVPISGTISRNSNGEVSMKGKGQGQLVQGSLSYKLGIEMETSYVDPRVEKVSFWYFGGGEFARRGNYVDWPGVKGTFEAPVNCKQVLYSKPCPRG